MGKPRHQCERFMWQNNALDICEELPKDEFNRLCRDKAFDEGPFRDTFGDGPGEPYNPWRQAFGRIGARYVYTELSPAADTPSS